jgi:hypothetical protein
MIQNLKKKVGSSERNNGRVQCNYDRESNWSLNRVSHFLLQGTTMKVTVASAVMLAVLGLVQGHSYHLGATCPNVEPVSNFNLDKVSRLVILKSNKRRLIFFVVTSSRWDRKHFMIKFVVSLICRYFEHIVYLFVKRAQHFI